MTPSLGVLLGSNTAGTSLTTAVDVPPGDRVIYVLEDFSNTLAISSFTSGGLTWVVDQAKSADANNVNVIIVSADAPAGVPAGTALAPTVTGSTVPMCCAFSITTGIGGASGYLSGTPPAPVDTFGGSTTWTTPSLTTVDASTLVLGVVGADGVGTMSSTPVSGTEIYDIVNAGTTEFLTVVYRVLSSAGPVTCSGTFSATPGEYRKATVAYKAAGPPPVIAPDYSRFPKPLLRR